MYFINKKLLSFQRHRGSNFSPGKRIVRKNFKNYYITFFLRIFDNLFNNRISGILFHLLIMLVFSELNKRFLDFFMKFTLY